MNGTYSISKRLDRLEDRVNANDESGYGPVFKFVDDPRSADTQVRLVEAARFVRDNPDGLLIHRHVVAPPKGKSNWEEFQGFMAQITEQQVSAQNALLADTVQKVTALS